MTFDRREARPSLLRVWPLLSSLLLAMTLSVPAHAADCVMQLSDPVVDYGVINRGYLAKASGNSLQQLPVGKRSLTLTAACEQPTRMNLSFKGDGVDAQRFRFARNGSFKLKIIGAQLDSRLVALQSIDGDASAGHAQWLRPSDALVPHEDQQPVSGRHLMVHLEIETWIDDAAIRVRNEEQLKGMGSFQVSEH